MRTQKPKLFLMLLLSLSFLLCLGNCQTDDQQTSPIDPSTCQTRFDWSILLSAPLLASNYLDPVLTLAYQLDSLPEGDSITLEQYDGWEGRLEGSHISNGTFFRVWKHMYKCKSSMDTCYWMPGMEQYSRVYMHRDTIEWPSYKIMGGDIWAALRMCQLDAQGGYSYYINNGNAYVSTQYTFRPHSVLIDTVSDPTKRSDYQRWWPLPRIPWPVDK